MAALQNSLRQVNFCATCFSAGPDDALHPLTKDITIILKHLLHEFDLDGCLKLLPPDKVLKLCQSCHKTIKDMVAFKKTALKSLKHLKKQWHDHWLKSVRPTTSQIQHEDAIMVTPKAEPLELDPLDGVSAVYTHTHESSDISNDIKEEIIENNDGFDIASEQSAKNDMDFDNNVVPKKECMVSQQIKIEMTPEGNDPSANVNNVSNVNSTKMPKAEIKNVHKNESKNVHKNENKNVHKNESKNIANPILNTQQNASISVGPQSFGQRIGTLTPLLPFVRMPLISGTQGAASQVKFVNLIPVNAGTSNLVPISRPMLVKYPDGSTKWLNPTMPATVTNPTTRMAVPRAITTTTFPRYETTNKLLIGGTKLVKKPRGTPTKVAKCDSSNEVKVKKKKKPSVIQHPWYITVLTRVQLSQYREEKLKDPMFIRAPFKCMACGAHYDENYLLLLHQNFCNSQSKENAEFPCSVCNCSFDTLRLYTRHFRFHTRGYHVYQCPTCQYNVTSIKAMSAHVCPNKGSKEVPPMDPKMVLSRSRNQFYCPKCEYVSIRSITMLKAHYHRTHKNNCAAKCEVCGKFFSDQYTYETHKRSRHQLGKPVASCGPCQLQFHSMAAYKMHMNTLKHASEDQFIYECDECSKKFHLKKNLEEHKKMHEVMAGEKSHVCTVCGRGYQLASSLACHMLHKHSVREPVRSHVCDVCGDAFFTKTTLRGHMARHSDARPYKCKFCDDTFKQHAAWYTHMKLKHKYIKGRPYDKTKKEKAISAKNKTEHKLEKRRANKHGLESREQSIETQEHEQSLSPEDGNRETMDYDQILELQTFDNTMET